jgi:hypothetical protein
MKVTTVGLPGGMPLWLSWLSSNTRASPRGTKPHGSPEEYSQNKLIYQSSRSFGNNGYFYFKTRYIFNVKKIWF